mgnify:CR=1 FL=1
MENIRKSDRMWFGSYALSIFGAGASRWVGECSWKEISAYVFWIEQVTHGNAIFIQNGKEYLVNEGEVFLVFPGASIEYRVGPAGVLHKRFAAFCGFATPMLLKTMGISGRDVVHPKRPGDITKACRQLYALMGKEDDESLEDIAVLAYKLLLMLSRDFRPDYPEAINKALLFFEQNLNRHITQEEICAHVHLTPPYFCKLFKRFLGVAPMKYHATQRIGMARRLLTHTSMPIKEIALTSGYSDQLHFSAQFKKYTHVSPREYRRRTTNKGPK